MIALEDITVILLAAGLSRRFGAADKLAQQFRGKPLLSHIGDTLGAMPFRRRLLVCTTTIDLAGFERIDNAEPERGLGHSLALGARAAGQDAGAVMICLGDMPLVTSTHIQALAQRFDAATADIVASPHRDKAGPPALFGSRHVPHLASLDGDHGAKALLASAVLVHAPQGELLDFDLPQDFARP